jgi:hypothetical protein
MPFSFPTNRGPKSDVTTQVSLSSIMALKFAITLLAVLVVARAATIVDIAVNDPQLTTLGTSNSLLMFISKCLA